MFQKLPRGPKLPHHPLLKHHNPITIQDRINAMRNGNNGAFTEQRASKCCLEQSIGFDVDGCCCFVEDEDVGGGEEGAGEGDELPLALGEVAAAVGGEGVLVMGFLI